MRDIIIYTIEDIKELLQPIFVKFNVKKAILFGSYSKGVATERSDVDLILDSGLTGLNFVSLIEGVRLVLNKERDVFDKTHIIPNSKISAEISKDGVVLYEDIERS